MRWKVYALLFLGLACLIGCDRSPSPAAKNSAKQTAVSLGIAADCVICIHHKMDVMSDTPSTEFKDKRYYFCSAFCKKEFEKDPEQAIAKYEAAQSASEHSASTRNAESTSRPVGISLHAWEEDVPRKAELEQNGTVRIGHDVVAWLPSRPGIIEGRAPTTLPVESDIDAIVARLDRGVAAAKRFIGKPDWSFRGDPRVYFYFPDANFISHAPGGNTAFIPLWRIRDDQAPWLHEALHLLLTVEGGDWLAQPDEAMARMPLWLHEGLADALAIEISAGEGLAYYSPLIEVAPDKLDEFAAAQVRSCPDPTRLLTYIGGRGKMPELFGERRLEFAAAYYAASASFVRFIAKRHGYAPLVTAISQFNREHEELERLTGEDLASAKGEWLKAIDYQP